MQTRSMSRVLGGKDRGGITLLINFILINPRPERWDKRLWKCPRKRGYKILQAEQEEGMMERTKVAVSTLHSRLLRKSGLKSPGAESSVRVRDQDFSEAKDKASISARGI